MDSPDSSDSHSPYGPQNVIQDFLVFNVDSWLHKDAELIDFGNDNIERLINWFEPALRTAGCEVDDILPQWQSMKITFNSQFATRITTVCGRCSCPKNHTSQILKTSFTWWKSYLYFLYRLLVVNVWSPLKTGSRAALEPP